MDSFKEIFNRSSIYEMLFFNITGILEYKSLSKLRESNSIMYNIWMEISKGIDDELYYTQNAINYPEFVRILSISYATVYYENSLKRNFKKIINENEFIVISTFIDILHQISTDDSSNSPKKSTILCGDNIISNDIPLLIKRFLIHRENMERKDLPAIIKNYLFAKPWESAAIDTRMVWKFNGLNAASVKTQTIYSDFLSLKKTTNLMSISELSQLYWDAIDIDIDKAHNEISLQSATKVNLSIQLINTLRDL